jgi:hypothetical protein
MLTKVDISQCWTFFGVKPNEEVGFWMAGQQRGRVVWFNAHPFPLNPGEDFDLGTVQVRISEVSWVGWQKDLVVNVWVKNMAGYGAVQVIRAQTIEHA